MATQLQEDLADAIIANKKLPRDKRKNKKELLVSMGYSKVTAESIPSTILESKGVKKALADRGLTEDLIKNSLVDDIIAKPKNRARELALGADILGMIKDKDKGSKTLILVVSGESAKRYAINESTSTDSDRPTQV